MQQSTPFVLFRLFWVGIGFVACSLGVLLLFSGESVNGRFVALGVLFLFPSPLFKAVIPGVRGKWIFAIVALTGIALLVFAWARTPDGKPVPCAAFRSIYRGTASYRRLSPAQMVPEVDQHLMGTYVFTALDPFIDGAQAREVRKKFLSIYLPMECDPEFAAAGNVMGLCYRDLFYGRTDTGHAYVYRPPGFEGKRLPAFVFLHGSLGNFKGNLWCWKTFSDRHGYAIVAPSFGQGNWNERGGVDEIGRAVEYCRETKWIDSERLYLAGVSNGGLGVTRGLTAMPDAFSGVFYLSPVLEQEEVERETYTEAAREKPIFVLSGDLDRRIPPWLLKRAVETMANNGLDASFELVPREDHFLFYSQPELMLSHLKEWLDRKGI